MGYLFVISRELRINILDVFGVISPVSCSRGRSESCEQPHAIILYVCDSSLSLNVLLLNASKYRFSNHLISGFMFIESLGYRAHRVKLDRCIKLLFDFIYYWLDLRGIRGF